MPDINTAVTEIVRIANDNTHGYDQKNRYGVDYDCSSLVAHCLNKAGFKVSKYSYTGNLEKQLRACGFTDCDYPWRAGDVHLKVNKHVCMSVDAFNVAEASINEKGKATGGKKGDQTGKEIWVHPYYNYKSGWDVHLRFPTAEKKTATVDIAKEVIAGKWGSGVARKSALESAGYDYTEVQNLVNSLLTAKQSSPKKSDMQIAREVLAGKWGNGNTRKTNLESAGYNYNTIRKLVNQLWGKR